MTTTFFKNCFGVFQGGGTRAAAFAGAYRVTYDAGIRFSEVAGTSAGSIIAVLIGAGASPEFIENALLGLDFGSLLRPPETQHRFASVWPRCLGRVIAPFGYISTNVRAASQVLRYGGCHSSRGIEEWIEKQLSELLPDAKPPVSFRDLRIPTYVVATNLATKSPKVWSTDNEDDSVALAVRGSCSIPLFFQPLLVGDTRLVDGGMLSNLPAFVFEADTRRPARRLARRILAYRLQAETSPLQGWTPAVLTAQLIDTMISGATELQVGILRSVSCIDIPTAGVRATDFGNMGHDVREMLLRNGRTAAERFLESEAIQLRGHGIKTDTMHDRDEVYLAVTRQTNSLPSEVLIGECNTDWYWRIFPTVLYWRMKGVPVRVLLQPPSGNSLDLAKERSRRLNLVGVGAHVEVVDRLPIQGYVFSRAERDASAAIVFLPQREHSPMAVLYDGSSNQQIIDLVQECIAAAFSKENAESNFVPSLVAVGEDELCQALKKGVSQYTPTTVEITVEPVTIRGARSITKLIHAYKYEQMQRLVELMEEAKIPLFSPCAVVLADGRRSMMGPPVFEVHGRHYFGIEGNTRTYYSSLTARDSMLAVVVKGVQAVLPGLSVDVSECGLVEWREDPAVCMPGYDYNLFRRIEGACHPHR